MGTCCEGTVLTIRKLGRIVSRLLRHRFQTLIDFYLPMIRHLGAWLLDHINNKLASRQKPVDATHLQLLGNLFTRTQQFDVMGLKDH